MKLKKVLASILCVAMVFSTIGTVIFAESTCSITPGYTSATAVWGEAVSGAAESLVIELYADDVKIATSTLNNIGGIIDGNFKNLTWNIPFAGSTDEYWTVEWFDGNPFVGVLPTKVVLVVDGETVAENNVQMNGPDNSNPVAWNRLNGVRGVAEIDGVKYATLEDALADAVEGDTIEVLADIALKDVIVLDKAITINGNNHKFTFADDYNYVDNKYGNIQTAFKGIMIDAKAAATIKNIYFDGEWNRYTIGVALRTLSGATVDSCIFDGFTNGDSYGVDVSNGANVLNSTFNDCFRAIAAYTSGNTGDEYAIISGNTVNKNCTYGYNFGNALKVKMSENEFNGNWNSGLVDNAIIKDNTFIAYDGSYNYIRFNSTDEDGISFPNIFKTAEGNSATNTINLLEKATHVDLRNSVFESEVEFDVKDTNVSSVTVYPVYLDEEKTEKSSVSVSDNASVGNVSVSVPNFESAVPYSDLTNNSSYAVNIEKTSAPLEITVDDDQEVEYLDIYLTKNGSEFQPSSAQTVKLTLSNPFTNAEVKHWNGASWEDVSSTLNDSTVTFKTSTFSPFAVVYNATAVTEAATEIKVEFESVSDTEYNIVLESTDGKYINRFMSAELAFEYVPTDGVIDYRIEGVGNVNVIDPATSGKDAYEFNLNGTAPDMTGTRLVIGKAIFTGYGKGSFNTKGTDINFVNTAEIADNIVTQYVVGGAADKGTLVLPDAATDNVEITVPTQKLTVNVTFPNAVDDNAKTYQDMKVTISGGDLSEDIVKNLGTDENAQTDGAYKVTADLTQNIAYTVTVTGAGYRTARYTVTMTADKTLNFWNNVKDNAVEVETGKASSAVTKNFLAGDIVKDNKINIYDLSAVVSYFGTENLTTSHPEYAKYDLNRDGVIDSKDVAYVLVSWGN